MTRHVTDADLLLRHARVLFRTDRCGRLTGLNEPGSEPAPRLFLVRGLAACRAWFRADVPASKVEVCRRIARGLPSWDGEEPDPSAYDGLRAAIARDAPIEVEDGGPAFRFDERVVLPAGPETLLIDERSSGLLERHFPYTRSVLAARRPVVGAIVDGNVVAACFSARRRRSACEAGVATEDAYRGRGLAPLVVSAWRDAVEREGSVALYSTSWGNHASRRVARKLRLVPYADTLSLT